MALARHQKKLLFTLWLVLSMWRSNVAIADEIPRQVFTGTSELKGPWKFYWKKLLKPGEDFPQPDAMPISNLLFDEIQLANKTFASKYGYATYRLDIGQLSPSSNGYELMTSPRGAEHIFIYETKSGNILFERQLGVVDSDIGVPSRRRQLVHCYIEKPTDVTILIQTSNFVFYTGGLWGPPRLSSNGTLYLD